MLSSGTIKSLQFLRFIAAAMVVYQLADSSTYVVHRELDPTPIPWLTSGVDIFFVISGFMMAYTVKADMNPGGFALRRILRIVPLYWLVTLAALALALLAPVYGFKVPTAWSTIQSMSFAALGRPYLSVGWPLEYGMLFYGILTLCLLISRYWLPTLVVVIVGTTFVFATLTPYGTFFEWYADRALMLEFLAGIVVFHLSQRYPMSPIVGLCLAVAGFAVLPFIKELAPWPRGLYYGLPSIFIMLGFVVMEPWFSKTWARTGVALGDASYSIYLGHFIVLIPLARIVLRNDWWPNFATTPIITTLALFVCGILAGVILYVAVEVPIRWCFNAALRHSNAKNATDGTNSQEDIRVGKWTKTWPDKDYDFTARLPADPDSFVRVYRARASPDSDAVWRWVVTVHGQRIASGHEPEDGPEGVRAAVRAAEKAWAEWKALRSG